MQKKAYWFIALVVLIVFAGCTDEESEQALDSLADGDEEFASEESTETERSEEGEFEENEIEAEESEESSAFSLDWSALSNPILAEDDRMLKDVSVIYHEGWFYLFSSTRFEEDDPERANKTKTFYKSEDLKNWQPFHDEDLSGVGSPEVIPYRGGWLMVYQSGSDPNDDFMRRLFISYSDDLIDWQPPVEIAKDAAHPGASIIDGAIAPLSNGEVALIYKHRSIQMPFVTLSTGGLEGDFEEPAYAELGGKFGWAENFQFIQIDGQWRLVATGNDPSGRDCESDYTCNHEPFIYRKANQGDTAEGWRVWTDKTLLEIPFEDWNQDMHANTGHLKDWREFDGYFYLFYAGSNDHESFSGRGHGKIGVARSKDLSTWKVAGRQ